MAEAAAAVADHPVVEAAEAAVPAAAVAAVAADEEDKLIQAYATALSCKSRAVGIII